MLVLLLISSMVALSIAQAPLTCEAGCPAVAATSANDSSSSSSSSGSRSSDFYVVRREWLSHHIASSLYAAVVSQHLNLTVGCVGRSWEASHSNDDVGDMRKGCYQVDVEVWPQHEHESEDGDAVGTLDGGQVSYRGTRGLFFPRALANRFPEQHLEYWRMHATANSSSAALGYFQTTTDPSCCVSSSNGGNGTSDSDEGEVMRAECECQVVYASPFLDRGGELGRMLRELGIPAFVEYVGGGGGNGTTFEEEMERLLLGWEEAFNQTADAGDTLPAAPLFEYVWPDPLTDPLTSPLPLQELLLPPPPPSCADKLDHHHHRHEFQSRDDDQQGEGEGEGGKGANPLCSYQVRVLRKEASEMLLREFPEANFVLNKMALTAADMQLLMKRVHGLMAADVDVDRDTAVDRSVKEWVDAHPTLVRSWLPSSCSSQGLVFSPLDASCRAGCPLGTQPWGLLECRACPPGTYRDDIELAACLPCPPGTYHNASLSEPACAQCPLGTFSVGEGQGTCVQCRGGQGLACNEMAVGVRPGYRLLEPIRTRTGGEVALVVAPCPVKEACLASQWCDADSIDQGICTPSKDQLQATHGHGTEHRMVDVPKLDDQFQACAEHYRGNLCSSCSDGSTRLLQGQCVACAELLGRWDHVLISVSVVIFLVLCLCFVFINLRKNRGNQINGALGKIFLNYLHLVSLAFSAAAFDFGALFPSYVDAARIAGNATLQPDRMLYLGCLFQYLGYEPQVLPQINLVIAFVAPFVITGVANVVAYCCPGDDADEDDAAGHKKEDYRQPMTPPGVVPPKDDSFHQPSTSLTNVNTSHGSSVNNPPSTNRNPDDVPTSQEDGNLTHTKDTEAQPALAPPAAPVRAPRGGFRKFSLQAVQALQAVASPPAKVGSPGSPPMSPGGGENPDQPAHVRRGGRKASVRGWQGENLFRPGIEVDSVMTNATDVASVGLEVGYASQMMADLDFDGLRSSLVSSSRPNYDSNTFVDSTPLGFPAKPKEEDSPPPSPPPSPPSQQGGVDLAKLRRAIETRKTRQQLEVQTSEEHDATTIVTSGGDPASTPGGQERDSLQDVTSSKQSAAATAATGTTTPTGSASHSYGFGSSDSVSRKPPPRIVEEVGEHMAEMPPQERSWIKRVGDQNKMFLEKSHENAAMMAKALKKGIVWSIGLSIRVTMRLIALTTLDLFANRIAMILMLIFHPVIIKTYLDSISCVELLPEGTASLAPDANRWFMKTNLDRICPMASGVFEWDFWLASAGLLIWGILFPLFGFILIGVRQEAILIHAEERARFGFMINGYREDFYHWECVQLLRKVILLVCLALPYGNEFRAFWMLVFGVVFLSFQLVFQPYDDRHHNMFNRLEQWSLVNFVVTLFAAIFWSLRAFSDTYDADALNQGFEALGGGATPSSTIAAQIILALVTFLQTFFMAFFAWAFLRTNITPLREWRSLGGRLCHKMEMTEEGFLKIQDLKLWEKRQFAKAIANAVVQLVGHPKIVWFDPADLRDTLKSAFRRHQEFPHERHATGLGKLLDRVLNARNERYESRLRFVEQVRKKFSSASLPTSSASSWGGCWGSCATRWRLCWQGALKCITCKTYGKDRAGSNDSPHHLTNSQTLKSLYKSYVSGRSDTSLPQDLAVQIETDPEDDPHRPILRHLFMCDRCRTIRRGISFVCSMPDCGYRVCRTCMPTLWSDWTDKRTDSNDTVGGDFPRELDGREPHVHITQNHHPTMLVLERQSELGMTVEELQRRLWEVPTRKKKLKNQQEAEPRFRRISRTRTADLTEAGLRYQYTVTPLPPPIPREERHQQQATSTNLKHKTTKLTTHRAASIRHKPTRQASDETVDHHSTAHNGHAAGGPPTITISQVNNAISNITNNNNDSTNGNNLYVASLTRPANNHQPNSQVNIFSHPNMFSQPLTTKAGRPVPVPASIWREQLRDLDETIRQGLPLSQPPPMSLDLTAAPRGNVNSLKNLLAPPMRERPDRLMARRTERWEREREREVPSPRPLQLALASGPTPAPSLLPGGGEEPSSSIDPRMADMFAQIQIQHHSHVSRDSVDSRRSSHRSTHRTSSKGPGENSNLSQPSSIPSRPPSPSASSRGGPPSDIDNDTTDRDIKSTPEPSIPTSSMVMAGQLRPHTGGKYKVRADVRREREALPPAFRFTAEGPLGGTPSAPPAPIPPHIPSGTIGPPATSSEGLPTPDPHERPSAPAHRQHRRQPHSGRRNRGYVLDIQEAYALRMGAVEDVHGGPAEGGDGGDGADDMNMADVMERGVGVGEGEGGGASSADGGLGLGAGVMAAHHMATPELIMRHSQQRGGIWCMPCVHWQEMMRQAALRQADDGQDSDEESQWLKSVPVCEACMRSRAMS
ncbi:unnamed protein product [Vitrella brassicaformis CCMP3155]|uniref:Tyrosine-protein kinase ephrin type A/B receptor-like domain-containing protein n=3 Tax=Vitrella brassicaformis TaxID=1169539 RepID=A0A0G4G6X7_VITBC|nr:unnamed protein product [Vitrella brassicaformis CCMP3155]|eukprot:CEM24129.1 unnamed protein product [Vitrella brassicaformis CCMP3155]